jgi:AcrR family transcriptional regulator
MSARSHSLITSDPVTPSNEVRSVPRNNLKSLDTASDSEPALGRREKLLLIAARLFLSKGYSATSIDDIAEAAGTTGPALYRIFDSKQDILDQLCLTGMDMRLQAIQASIDRHPGDPHATLRELVRARINFAFGAWGAQAPITLTEYKYLSPAARRQVDTASEISLSEWLRRLGQVRPETPTRELLATIYAVLMEITFVALHVDDLQLDQNVRSILERTAMAGLTSGQ